MGLETDGRRVVVTAVDEESAIATTNEIEARGGKALALKVDASVPEDTREMARKTVEPFDKIDILVNNAVIYLRLKMFVVTFYQLDPEEWGRLDVNFFH